MRHAGADTGRAAVPAAPAGLAWIDSEYVPRYTMRAAATDVQDRAAERDATLSRPPYRYRDGLHVPNRRARPGRRPSSPCGGYPLDPFRQRREGCRCVVGLASDARRDCAASRLDASRSPRQHPGPSEHRQLRARIVLAERLARQPLAALECLECGTGPPGPRPGQPELSA
jgi:hypothetical protein